MESLKVADATVMLPKERRMIFGASTMEATPSSSNSTSAEFPEDGLWLERARAGDAEAFTELCQRYAGRLFRQAMALCGDAAAAEDLVQDTLIAAWKGLGKFRAQCQWFTWLCGILIRLHRRSFRGSRPVTMSQLANGERQKAELLLEWATDPTASPDRLLQLGEHEAMLRGCLSRLSARHRQVVFLRFYVDSSLEGIAEALGCSLGTVKSRLFHALKKLASMPELKSILKS